MDALDLHGILDELLGLYRELPLYQQVGGPMVAVLTLAGLAMALRPTPRPSAARIERPSRPGWAARRRARRGARHPKAGWTVGYRSFLRSVRVDWRVLKLGGLIFGSPGSGKTNTLRGLVQAAAESAMGAVIIDPKGEPELRQVVADLGGLVWTIGGFLRWDPLERDPEKMAEQLLEGEPDDSAAPKVFRGGARLAAQQLGQAMVQAGEQPDIRKVVPLL